MTGYRMLDTGYWMLDAGYWMLDSGYFYRYQESCIWRLMANSYFQFKQFIIHQDKCAMKVTTDACLFGSLLPSSSIERVKNVLDIGTGTGLLALMYAQKNKDAILDAVEIDKETAMQAKQNIDASIWQDRINIIHADVKAYPFSKKYDLIISNPPFYEKELRAGNRKKNIAHHNEALLLNELLEIIKTNLNPDGIFCLLLPYKRNEEIKKLVTENEFVIIRMTFIRQSVNHDYFRIILMGKLKNDEVSGTVIDEISIWDEKQQYTQEFVELLKDYYLHL